MPTYGKYRQATGDNQAVPRVILTRLQKEAIIDTFFGKYMGTTSESIVQVKKDLEKKKGDTISFGIRMKLKGAATTEGQRMQGREEALKKYMCDVVLARYRHAVKVEMGISEQRDNFSMSVEAQDALREWMTEMLDDLSFNELYNAHTNIYYGGTATTIDTITDADELTPTFLKKLATIAKTGYYRQFNPIAPLKVDGSKYWKLLVSPGTLDKLANNPTMQQFLLNAAPRSIQENPLFKGSSYVCHGIAIEDHERVKTDTNTGGIHYAENILLGAQSLVWAWGEQPNIVSKDDDYEEDIGHCIRVTCGVKKPTFNSQVYNSLIVRTSETKY